MIYKITLETRKRKTIIPFNYQYPMSCWIYNLIRQVDPTFSDFIHDDGYYHKKKQFKLFSFSNLDFWYQRTKQGLKMRNNIASFKIGFLSNDVKLNVIQGFFHNQPLRIGETTFRVKNVEQESYKIETQTIQLKTISPIVIKNQHEKYLQPNEVDYETIFENNLKQKYVIATQKGWLPETDLDQGLSIQLLSKAPRQKGIKIKYEKNQVIGYQYDFELTAPKVLIETGLLAGFGSQNAQGFGFCEILKN